MEKKEILKIVNECFSCDCSVEYPDSELYFMNDFMEKKFMDFISQELGKAREEGYEEGCGETLEAIKAKVRVSEGNLEWLEQLSKLK